MYLIVCYDIVTNRRRARLSKGLKGFLPRVQKSVFEGEIADDRLEKLRELILNEVDLEQDTVRIYRVCERCIPATEVFGVGFYVERGDPDEVV